MELRANETPSTPKRRFILWHVQVRHQVHESRTVFFFRERALVLTKRNDINYRPQYEKHNSCGTALAGLSTAIQILKPPWCQDRDRGPWHQPPGRSPQPSRQQWGHRRSNCRKNVSACSDSEDLVGYERVDLLKRSVAGLDEEEVDESELDGEPKDVDDVVLPRDFLKGNGVDVVVEEESQVDEEEHDGHTASTDLVRH